MHNQKQLGALRQLSGQLQRQLDRLPLERVALGPEIPAAELVLKAFPEWLALRRTERPGRFQLRQGRGARLDAQDPLINAEALAVARLDHGHRDTRIRLHCRSAATRLIDWQRGRVLAGPAQLGRTGAAHPRRADTHARRPQLARTPASPGGQQCRGCSSSDCNRAARWTCWAGHLRLCSCDGAWIGLQAARATLATRDPEGLLGSLSDWLGDTLEGCQAGRISMPQP